jgi:hypothetical protein
MKWLPVAVFAVVASWTGVVGERADSPTHDASGTAGAEELGKRFIRGGRDESIVAFQDREIEAGAVTSDADASMRNSTPRFLADTFVMQANIRAGPGVSLFDATRSHIVAGCGHDNSKCHCSNTGSASVSMVGRGTTSTATGLDFACTMEVVGAGGQSASCTWRLKMPYVGDNHWYSDCTGFAFLVSGFKSKGTNNVGIEIEVVAR